MGKGEVGGIDADTCQTFQTARSLPLPWKPYESIFARIFLFLERHEFFGSARTV